MASPLVVSKEPICSLARLRELGLDTSRNGSCAPPPDVSGDKTVMGCSDWPNCRFSNPAYGTFKGVKPQRIGYRYRTIEGRSKRDIIICHGFVRTLQGAMDQGVADKLRGAPNYEIVQIIAQEGEPITRTVTKIVTNKDGTSKLVRTEETIPVPAIKDPGEMEGFSEFDEEPAA